MTVWRRLRAGIMAALAVSSLHGGAVAPADAAPSGAFAASSATGQAYATCVQPTADEAQACAQRRCVELARLDKTGPKGAALADRQAAEADAGDNRCQIVATCLPAGWSGAMVATLGEFHFTNTICGAPSRQAAIEALTAFCKAHLPEMLECVIVSLWSPVGIQDDLDLVLGPGDFTAEAEQE